MKCELINAIKLWFTKQMTLNAEVSFNTFGKELGFSGLVLAVLLPNLSLQSPRGSSRTPKGVPSITFDYHKL